jgi:hypothetical protein
VARVEHQLVAVLVDGVQHYTWPRQRPTGPTLARNRALERRGYRVVCVPVNKVWARLPVLQEQQRCLQSLLNEATALTVRPGAVSNSRSGSSSSSDRAASQPVVDKTRPGRKVRAVK